MKKISKNCSHLNPIALRKAKIVYNFGLSECNRVNYLDLDLTVSLSPGAIQIKNWKPLHFEAISDEKTATIEDILGELTQVATLRIRICR